MKLHKGHLLLPLGALALGGCQLFGSPAAFDRTAVASQPDMTSYFAQRLAEGRQHMQAGRAASAINAFRQASYHPDYAAASYNGMAVAYAHIGRQDLAERFFLAALERDPGNASYSRNLARLQNTPLAPTAEVAPALATAPEAKPQPAAVPVQQRLGGAVSATSRTTDRMQRVSNREVRIGGGGDTATAAVSIPVQRPAIVHIASRGAAVRGETRAPVSAVRVALPGPGVAKQDERTGAPRIRVSSPREQGAGYPVRVSLPPA